MVEEDRLYIVGVGVKFDANSTHRLLRFPDIPFVKIIAGLARAHRWASILYASVF